ncbi:MAG: YidC/Oxa1 family membrane protein insertase [Chloroflexota bacterium]
MGIGEIWDLIILSPLINVLIVVSHYLWSNFGLAIIVLTIVIRALMYPLTFKQLQSSKAMQSIQPKMAELQKKYGRDKQQLAREQMRLYKEAGMSPTGCLGPMIIQMPIWIALYQAIIRVSAIAPEDFLNLSRHLYSSWSLVFSTVPLDGKFLWLDLAMPDAWLILPILVGVTMWIQQKMTMLPNADPRQQQQAQMMLWIMPLMFAYLTLQFPSGLALYWVISNIISIVMQYFVTGWGGLKLPSFGQKTGGQKKIKGPASR